MHTEHPEWAQVAVTALSFRLAVFMGGRHNSLPSGGPRQRRVPGAGHDVWYGWVAT